MKTETTHTHTQGPWKAHAAYFFGRDSFQITGKNGDSSPFLCRLTDDTHDYEANARLIYAAPELLACLLDVLDADGDLNAMDFDRYRATIAKVEGNA